MELLGPIVDLHMVVEDALEKGIAGDWGRGGGGVDGGIHEVDLGDFMKLYIL